MDDQNSEVIESGENTAAAGLGDLLGLPNKAIEKVTNLVCELLGRF